MPRIFTIFIAFGLIFGFIYDSLAANIKPDGNSEVPLELPLQAAWQYAVSHSSDALQARYESRKAQRESDQAAWDLLPTLSLQGGYVLEDSDGDSRWTGNVQIQSASGGLGRQIFMFSIRDTIKSLGEAKTDAMYDDLFFKIAQAYATYFYFDELRVIQDSAKDELKELSVRLNLENKKGRLGPFDAMQIKKKLLDARYQEKNLAVQQHEALLRIKKLIGVPGDQPFKPLGSMAGIAACIDTPDIYKLNHKKNLELEVLRTKLELQSSQTLFSRLRQFPMPDYSLQVGFGQEARPYWTVRNDLNDVHYHLFVGLKWDLITWGRIGRDIADNRDKEELLRKKMENTVQELVNFCNFAQKKSDNHKERIRVLSRYLLEYGNIVKASRKQYLMGRIKGDKWLQIRQNLLSGQSEIVNLHQQELQLNLQAIHILSGLRKYLDKCGKH